METLMREGWRWYGPDDPVSLDDVRQAGAKEIVSALHQVPIGEAWTERGRCGTQGHRRGEQAGAARLDRGRVDPDPDDVKRTGGQATRSIDAWIASLEALAANDIRIVCYNFMPVIDWCRTDLEWELPNGARALRFDQTRFAAFDLYILARPGAEADYPEEMRVAARAAYEAMGQEEIDYLIMVIASALPGSTTEPLTIPEFGEKLRAYKGCRRERLAPAPRGVPRTGHPRCRVAPGKKKNKL
jgi:mannonate dehydratase